MRNIRHVVTHRCNELLKYDNNNYKPCAIQFDKWFPYDDKERTWILKTLESSEEDWDIKYMWNTAKIKFCPFCGEKLNPPLTLIESEQN
jgi:hypothetical protein